MAIQTIPSTLIADNAISAAKIASGIISADDIADNSLTAAKISASTSPTFGGLTLGNDSNGANIILKNSDYGNTGLARFFGTDGNEKLQIGANANTQAVMYTFSGVSLDFEIGANPSTLHLKSTGKVGIGTNIPDTLLELKNDTSSTTFGEYPAITIRNDNAAGVAAIHFNEGSTQRARIETHNNSGNPYLIINTTAAAANGIYINSSGFVGIGTTTTFSNPLTLNKAAGAAGSLNNQLAMTHTGASTAYYLKTIRASATDEPAGLAFVENTTERMRIDTSGNVGIGTDSPNLSSGASGSTVLTISASASAKNALIELDGTRTGDGDIVSYFRTFNNTAATPLTDIRSIRGASDTSGSLEFYTSNAKAMTIDSSGNLSMGSSTAATAYFSIDKATTGENGILFKNAGNNKIKLIQSAAEELEVYVNNTTLALVIAESGIADFGTTGALRLPRGTTGQRPTGAQGHIRYNNTTHKLEYYQTDLGEWLRIQTDGGINFVNPTTYFTNRFAISADGQSADADNTSGYGVVSTNANFEGNFIIITKWAHDYMGIGIAYKDNILNSNFTGESNDGAGPYGGNSNVDGFDSTVSYMGQYHWPVLNGGNDDHQTTWYIKHQRSGNTISTHYSTNSNAADDPVHSSWTAVQSTNISSTNHCKPVWGEASSQENQILTFTYKEVTGDYNFS